MTLAVKVALNPNTTNHFRKVLSFCNEQRILFYSLDLGLTFLSLVRFHFLTVLRDMKVAILTLQQAFQEQEDNHYVIYVNLLDIQDQLKKYILYLVFFFHLFFTHLNPEQGNGLLIATAI